MPRASGTEQRPVTEGRQAVSDQVAEAEAAIAGTDWKTAEAKLDPWLAAHPDDARALFDAGYVADVQDRAANAEAFYRRSIAADDNAFDPHLLLGILLARKGRPGEARTELRRATELNPSEGGPDLKARAWRALARIDSDRDASAASSDLIEALKLTPETVEDMLLAAELAVKADQIDSAESQYRRVLAKDPKSVPANAGLAHLLIKRKQFAEAEQFLRAALEHSADDPALSAQLAAVLAAQDKAEALPLLEKIHAAHPEEASIARMLAEVLAEAGDFAGSDALYLKLLATSPQDQGLLIGHGQNLVRQAKYAEALAVFEKATQIDPANGDGWSGLAFAASRSGHPDLTLHALAVRSRLLPENPSTYFLWATAYDRLRQNKQAAAYYRRFLDAAAGKYPDEEWQAKERLKVIEK